jgi:hypothetical protein
VREHFYRLAAEDNRRDTATPSEAIAIKPAFSRAGGVKDRLIDVLMLNMEPLVGDAGELGCSRYHARHFLGVSPLSPCPAFQ